MVAAGGGFLAAPNAFAAEGDPERSVRLSARTANGRHSKKPAEHRLVIHGMADRPLSLSMAEIRRLPSVTRTLVLECGGNSAGLDGLATAGRMR
jgi:DMSO/TMAO reductase YedYZ molybdopterin-dependent catalytic subunit